MARYHYDDDDEPYVVIEKHESAGFTPFLVGLAVGAGVALLLAPRSGRETRQALGLKARQVRDAAEHAVADVADGVADTFADARQRVEERIDSARQAFDLKRRQVTRAFDAGRLAAEETRLELEQRLAQTQSPFQEPYQDQVGEV